MTADQLDAVAGFSRQQPISAPIAQNRATPPDGSTGPEATRLWTAARDFETAYVAEMLKFARIGEEQGAFSGGYGAAAYRSFMVDAYADAMTEQHAFGLAEAVYATLRDRVGGDGA